MRGARLLSLASFRFSSRWTPLPRTMRFPLSGRARDFHPLDYAHVGRTKRGCVKSNWHSLFRLPTPIAYTLYSADKLIYYCPIKICEIVPRQFYRTVIILNGRLASSLSVRVSHFAQQTSAWAACHIRRIPPWQIKKQYNFYCRVNIFFLPLQGESFPWRRSPSWEGRDVTIKNLRYAGRPAGRHSTSIKGQGDSYRRQEYDSHRYIKRA